MASRRRAERIPPRRAASRRTGPGKRSTEDPHRMGSKQNQWIVGINAVASAVENDAGNVREVLLEAGAKNPRIGTIEEEARRHGIDVRRVAQQALDGVAGGLRHQGAVARYAAAKT